MIGIMNIPFHGYAESVASGTVAIPFADHTYVLGTTPVPPPVNCTCYGTPRWGAGAAPIVNTTGGDMHKVSAMINGSAALLVPAVYNNRPADNCGLQYLKDGVCHQMANRILYTARAVTFQPFTANVRGMWLSNLIYGVFGGTHLPQSMTARMINSARIAIFSGLGTPADISGTVIEQLDTGEEPHIDDPVDEKTVYEFLRDIEEQMDKDPGMNKIHKEFLLSELKGDSTPVSRMELFIEEMKQRGVSFGLPVEEIVKMTGELVDTCLDAVDGIFKETPWVEDIVVLNLLMEPLNKAVQVLDAGIYNILGPANYKQLAHYNYNPEFCLFAPLEPISG